MSTSGDAPVRAALVAGSVAAVAAALVSLPLHSPDDAFLNSGSVVAGVLVLSVVSGLWWRRVAVRAGSLRWFRGALAAGFLAWVGVAVALETELDRTVSFTVPLAAIAFGTLAALVPYLSRAALTRRWIVVGAAIALAAGTGVGLAERSDAESGRLELPPRAHVSVNATL